jgi:hypothetical protein
MSSVNITSPANAITLFEKIRYKNIASQIDGFALLHIKGAKRLLVRVFVPFAANRFHNSGPLGAVALSQRQVLS